MRVWSTIPTHRSHLTPLHSLRRVSRSVIVMQIAVTVRRVDRASVTIGASVMQIAITGMIAVGESVNPTTERKSTGRAVDACGYSIIWSCSSFPS